MSNEMRVVCCVAWSVGGFPPLPGLPSLSSGFHRLFRSPSSQIAVKCPLSPSLTGVGWWSGIEWAGGQQVVYMYMPRNSQAGPFFPD